MALGVSSLAYRARTLATQAGMINKWLAEQGLISVKEQWEKNPRLPDSAFIMPLSGDVLHNISIGCVEMCELYGMG
jgi:hypothetical protein